MTTSTENEIIEIRLHIDGKVFNVAKNVLCEHSDYFRAMFSGHYIEKEKKDITINVIDANTMDIIIKYMNIGLIDLSEHPLHIVGELAMAANFLQIIELIKQIHYYLDLQISVSTWVETMNIAERASYSKIRQISATFGLLSFKDMKPEYIPNVPKLFWYLSHPSLATESELDVFKFGYNWILQPETCPCGDILLIILGCLDVTKLTSQDLKELSMLMKDCETSLAAKVVECLKMLLDNKLKIRIKTVYDYRIKLCETFTSRVFREVYRLVNFCTKREGHYTTVMPMWVLKDGALEYDTHYMYTFSEKDGFKKWLSIANKDMWGWNLASWGASRLVQVCGEYGRGTGQFMKDVKVYDTLRKQWTDHGVQLPPRRHAGVTILGDSLFIIGGVGGCRVLQDSTIIYDLKTRTQRKAAKFPDVMQSPGVCTHYGSVYAAGHKNIYKYNDLGEQDTWVLIIKTNFTVNHLISFKEYIYCTQNYFSQLHRFRPGLDEKLEVISEFSAPPTALSSIGDSLFGFTRSTFGDGDNLNVEELIGYHMLCYGCRPRMVWQKKNADLRVNDVAGAFSLVLNMPQVQHPISEYHSRYVKRYAHISYKK